MLVAFVAGQRSAGVLGAWFRFDGLPAGAAHQPSRREPLIPHFVRQRHIEVAGVLGLRAAQGRKLISVSADSGHDRGQSQQRITEHRALQDSRVRTQGELVLLTADHVLKFSDPRQQGWRIVSGQVMQCFRVWQFVAVAFVLLDALESISNVLYCGVDRSGVVTSHVASSAGGGGVFVKVTAAQRLLTFLDDTTHV